MGHELGRNNMNIIGNSSGTKEEVTELLISYSRANSLDQPAEAGVEQREFFLSEKITIGKTDTDKQVTLCEDVPGWELLGGLSPGQSLPNRRLKVDGEMILVNVFLLQKKTSERNSLRAA